jgi:hypothetical protein
MSILFATTGCARPTSNYPTRLAIAWPTVSLRSSERPRPVSNSSNVCTRPILLFCPQ